MAFHNTIVVHYFPPHFFFNCLYTHTEPRSIMFNIIPSLFSRSVPSAPSFSLSITFFHRFIVLHLCYASQPIQFSESNPSSNIRSLICMCYIPFTRLALCECAHIISSRVTYLCLQNFLLELYYARFEASAAT